MLIVALTWWVFLQMVQHTYTASGAATCGHDEGMLVEFESSSISLNLPTEGIILQNGWKILPQFHPAVKNVINNYIKLVIEFAQCLFLQITKAEVDSFKPGKRIPSCRLKAEWTMQSNPSRLTYDLTLQGARPPSNYLKIDLDCDFIQGTFLTSVPFFSKLLANWSWFY